MKGIGKIIAGLLCLAMILTLPSCMDMGEGEEETSFYDYFSKVYLLSSRGVRFASIKKFNSPEEEGDNCEIQTVIQADKYAYMAFRVGKWDLTLEDFAFFAKTEQGEGTLELDFYISDTLPTKIKVGENDEYAHIPKIPDETDAPEEGGGNGTVATTAPTEIAVPQATGADGKPVETVGEEIYIPETDESGETVPREEIDESIFDALQSYAHVSFPITEEWRSTHLEFPVPQRVTKGQFVVIRIRNNCVLDKLLESEEAQAEPVSFTFNYLMFRFVNVKKL